MRSRISLVLIVMKLLCCLWVSAEEEKALFYNNRTKSVSVSPITLVGLLISVPERRNITDYIWFGIDLNLQQIGKKELGIGFYGQPSRYGIRMQQRNYIGKNHAGFMYGLYGLLEYRKMYWCFTEDNDIKVQSIIGNEAGEHPYHSVGVTFGGEIGYRIRGSRIGATLSLDAGLPLFYCFGNTPDDTDLFSFYGLNAMMRMFELGIKIDFY